MQTFLSSARALFEGGGIDASLPSPARYLADSSGGTLSDGNALPSPFALFLVQVVVILAMAKLIGWLTSPFKQPAVVAEMLAGIVLGPTVLGRAPGFSETLFPAASIKTLGVISSFGVSFHRRRTAASRAPASRVPPPLRACARA